MRTQNFSFVSRSWQDSHTSFLSLFLYQFVIFVQEKVLRKILRNKNSWSFLFLLWPLPFPTLLIHDKINAGNLIFPPISKELPTKGKIKEQRVGGFFCRDWGGGGRGRWQGLIILILSCQGNCTWVRVMLETWHRVLSYSFNKSSIPFFLIFLRTVECWEVSRAA